MALGYPYTTGENKYWDSSPNEINSNLIPLK